MWEGERKKERLCVEIGQKLCTSRLPKGHTMTLTTHCKICIISFTSNVVASIAAIILYSTINEMNIEHSKRTKVCPTAVSLLVDAILACVCHARSTND